MTFISESKATSVKQICIKKLKSDDKTFESKVTSPTQMSLLGAHSPTVKRRQSVAETILGARKIRVAAAENIFFLKINIAVFTRINC